MSRHGINDDKLAEALGMSKWLEGSVDFDQKAALKDLRRLHANAERRSGGDPHLEYLFDGTGVLSELVGLTRSECRLLEFAVVLHTDNVLDSAANAFESMTAAKLFQIIAVATDLPLETVKNGLAAKGRLAHSGLLALNRTGPDSLRQKLKLLSGQFAELLRAGVSTPLELLQGMVVEASSASLAMGDYPYLEPSSRLLLPYVRKALAELRVGVNILFYGVPGTGKGQFCRVVVQELCCQLYEVVCEDQDGDIASGGQRLCAYKAAQSVFARSGALLLFDEIEDIFQTKTNSFEFGASPQARKGWLNKILEENPVPTFWLTNDVGSLDPAFVRRFDMVVEFPVPPRSQREKIIREACRGELNEAHVRSIARSEHLAPAVMTRAANVIQAIRGELPEEAAPEALRRLIDSTLEAQGHPALPRPGSEPLPHCYDPTLLNASADLAGIARGLSTTRSGRLCLYGPPGTGKTAYGHWLAEQIGLPLHARRASDLLSMWVGESEKNIAEAFKQAERDHALLLIDEVDSFLRERQGASRSWEVTLVNELLTQVENYSGVFIASTNLMHDLDQAALRRFDLKVQFDYMLSLQAWRLFGLHCAEMGLPVPTELHRSRLGRLGTLTPGDFAAVVRRHRFSPLGTLDDFLRALEGECSVKAGGSRKAIGFGG